jgi:methionine-S-sulfoxide reductase
MKTLILAGGCFWGVENLFRNQIGVIKTRVGYCGGHTVNPVYEQVKTGQTGHAESIEISYDKNLTTLRKLLIFFFKIHDSTTLNRQGNDIGSQYRSIIFYNDAEEREIAEKLVNEMNAAAFLPGKIVTEIIPAQPFYEAETHHQDYLVKYPNGYTCHFIRQSWSLPE